MKPLMIFLVALSFFSFSRFDPKLIRKYNFSVDRGYDETWDRCLNVLKYYPINTFNKENGVIVTGPKVYKINGSDIEHYVALWISSNGDKTDIKYRSYFCLISPFGKSKGKCYRYLNPKLGWDDKIGKIEKSIIFKTKKNIYDNEKEELWEKMLMFFVDTDNEHMSTDVIDPINYSITTLYNGFALSFLVYDRSFNYCIKINISKENKLNISFYYDSFSFGKKMIDCDYCINKKHKDRICEKLIKNEDRILKELKDYFGDEMIIKVK